MRLPYATPVPSTEAESTILSAIQSRRAPRPLQPLDLTLLHSYPLASGWNSFLGSIRTQLSIPADLRELAISRVAVCNRAWYEWMHHAPLAVAAGVSGGAMDGVVKMEVLPETRPRAGDGTGDGVEEAKGGEEGEEKDVEGDTGELTEKQWLVLRYTDEMTRNVQVKDETFEELNAVFSDQEVVEITATISCYNCVSRFLVALDVGERNGTTPDEVGGGGH